MVLLAGLAWAASARAEPAALEMPSCVTGSPPLKLPANAERAVLDGPDGRRFHDAAQARYPLYQRGGLTPAQVLLVRRGGQWQYVTLWRSSGRALCFSAVFAAERFDFTPGWVAKYQPRAGAIDD